MPDFTGLSSRGRKTNAFEKARTRNRKTPGLDVLLCRPPLHFRIASIVFLNARIGVVLGSNTQIYINSLSPLLFQVTQMII